MGNSGSLILTLPIVFAETLEVQVPAQDSLNIEHEPLGLKVFLIRTKIQEFFVLFDGDMFDCGG